MNITQEGDLFDSETPIKNNFKLVKVFETGDMSTDLFETLRYIGCFVEDGTSEYTVGAIVHDIKNSSPEEDLSNVKKLDEWFILNGAKDKENVLIHHGTFQTDTRFLFK